jgi:serine/threonine protein kinase
MCKKAVLQELSVWASFRHENILPLLGYTSAEGFRLPALITEFMENGSLTDYIGKHPDSDLMRMVRRFMFHTLF